MRIKNGKPKLDPGEKRIGNFIVKDEDGHIKLSDIGGLFTHRMSKATPIGAFLKGAWDEMSADEQTKKGIGNWIAVIFTVFATVPDVDFMTEVYESAERCMQRHPEAYGMSAGPGAEEENAQVEREMKELMEFEESIKGAADAGKE